MSGSGAVEAIPRHIEIPDRLVRKICRCLSTRCHRRHTTACPRSSLRYAAQSFISWRLPTRAETVREIGSIQLSPGALLLARVDLGSVSPGDLVRQYLSIRREARAFNLRVRVPEPGSNQGLGAVKERLFHRHL